MSTTIMILASLCPLNLIGDSQGNILREREEEELLFTLPSKLLDWENVHLLQYCADEP